MNARKKIACNIKINKKSRKRIWKFQKNRFSGVDSVYQFEYGIVLRKLFLLFYWCK